MRPDSHEIFARRRSRNIGLGLVLGAFVLLVFAVSVVKIGGGAPLGHMEPSEATRMLPKAWG